ncbi:MAG: SpoIIE family protein phosphatase [Planctomycetota bacterium]
MPSIEVLTGPNPGELFPVRSNDSLGRDPACEITIAAPGISRRHVQFNVEGGEMYVADLGSVNGMFVNGAKVTRHKLSDGDTISLSEVSLRWKRADVPSATKRFGPRKAVPPTEPVDVLRARSLLAEAEADAESAEPEESYSFDATGSIATAMDFRLAPAEQVTTLQKRLALMFEVSQSLAVVKDRDELLGKIIEKLFLVFPHAEHGYVLVGSAVEQLQPALVRHRKDVAAKVPKLSRTIARKVFEQRRALICQNAAKDARFAHAQSILSLDLSSFMVAPLLYRDEVFGFIQLDSKRHFEKDDLNLLAGLAANAAMFLKNLRLFERVAKEVKEREEIQSELRIASRIQAALLPKSEPALSWLEVSGRMKTAKEVGGDYYDFIETPSGEVYVAIGDVSGKGVPAGLVMVMARSILHSLLETKPRDLTTVAIETNRILKKDLKPGMFLSLLLVGCDSKTKRLKLVGCGHERPLVYRARTRAVERLELGGTVLGVVADNSKQVTEREVELEPGDQVLLYTDGVTEALDAASKPFGIPRLEQTLEKNGDAAPAALLEAIQAQVAAHARGRDQHDDITLIALRRR